MELSVIVLTLVASVGLGLAGAYATLSTLIFFIARGHTEQHAG